jgi:1-acyl-sn-glycerol-3-phosphate acyltransferase
MGYILIDVCARFLYDAAFQDSVVAITDLHTHNLWQRMLATSRTTLLAEGRELLSTDTSYVYMSNHQSLLDIPILFASIPGSLRMVTKAELFKVPILGQGLERGGFILVDRKKRANAIAQLEKAKERLKEGISVWISPEGTRARDRDLELQPFKKGGFHVAMGLEVPIVPMWIEGAADVIFPGASEVYPNKTVSVYFAEPIQTKGLSSSQMPELMEQVRNAMLTLRERARTFQ